ncbi:MAG: hypothetical protein ACE5Q3_18045, partial [Alphaproteobacteria bacterium]
PVRPGAFFVPKPGGETMGKFNKATAAVVAGALVAVAGAFLDLEPELRSALQVVVTSALVWLVPNIAGEG